jgi:hypothetical protein
MSQTNGLVLKTESLCRAFQLFSAGEKGALCFADPLAAVGQTICWFRAMSEAFINKTTIANPSTRCPEMGQCASETAEIVRRAMADRSVYDAMAARENEVWGKILPALCLSPKPVNLSKCWGRLSSKRDMSGYFLLL